MNFTLILLIILAGIILSILVIAVYAFVYIRHHLRMNFTASELKEIMDAARKAKNGELQNDEPKSISAMTTIYEPLILEDFPDFNKELIFNKVESNMNEIYRMLETKKIVKNPDLQLMQNILEDKIRDLNQDGASVKYGDVKFHRHGIKEYIKKDGIATVKISSSLEYYFEDSRQKKKENTNGNKKQVSIVTTFIYVYDAHKIKHDKPIFVINCPNCGAPLRKLEDMCCEYCGTHINEVNLKTWLMSGYKEE